MTKSCCDDDLDIAENLRVVRMRMQDAAAASGRLEGTIRLMAVTKTVPPARVNCALREKVDLLGENRVQECCEKRAFYQCGAEQVHFIGHLQTNKIHAILDKVSMVESVDSLHLAAALDGECRRRGQRLDILLQVNIGEEPTKGGFPKEDLRDVYAEIFAAYPHVRVRGLMAIPPHPSKDCYFAQMQQLYEALRADAPPEQQIDTLSMGMSEDYERAIQYGSTCLRLGRAIFGARVKA